MKLPVFTMKDCIWSLKNLEVYLESFSLDRRTQYPGEGVAPLFPCVYVLKRIKLFFPIGLCSTSKSTLIQLYATLLLQYYPVPNLHSLTLACSSSITLP